MGVVHEHIRHELERIEILYTRKMQPEQPDQINPDFGQGKARNPKQQVDDDKILRNHRDVIQKPRTILIHHIFINLRTKVYIFW